MSRFFALLSPATAGAAMLSLLCATVLMSFKGVFARLSLDLGMSVMLVVFLRAAIAAPLFYLATRRRPQPDNPVERRDLWLAVACGGLFTLATVLDIYALSFMPLGVSRAILFTFPLFVQLLGMFHERRRPKPIELAVFGCSYAGLMLMLGLLENGAAAVPVLGALLCSLSAACYAGYLYYGRGISVRMGAARFSLASNLSTLVVFLLAMPFFASAADWPLAVPAVAWVTCMAVFSTVLPSLMLFGAMRLIEPARATLVSMGGPVISLSMGVLLFGEHLSLLQMLGFVFVIGGVGMLRRG